MNPQEALQSPEVDPLVTRAKLRLGSTLRNKWRLDVLLGVGGMASVYGATHRNGSRAAVKLLHPELMLNSEFRNRFLREGYAANAVDHDGCVKVIDDDTCEDGSLFLVTELLDGETLEERRVRLGGRLPEDEVLSVTARVLDVLAVAHAKGVVHRDIKPDNIFITRSGKVKVLDFGIARLKELSTKSTATKIGATMGTPAFMAPEQALGRWEEVDERSDLWAVGATMFHVLCARFVHEGRTVQEQLVMAISKPAQPILDVFPGVSPSVAQIVDTALRFDKGARWADAAAMRAAVGEASQGSAAAPMTAQAPLVVPASVPNRTLGPAQAWTAPPQTTTGGSLDQTVAADSLVPDPTVGRTHAGGMRGRAAILGSAVAIGIAAIGIVALLYGGDRGGGRASGKSAATAPSPPVTPTVAVTAAATLALPDPALPDPSPPPTSSQAQPAPAQSAAASTGGKPARPPRTRPITVSGPAVSAPPARPNEPVPCPVDPVTGRTRYTKDCVP